MTDYTKKLGKVIEINEAQIHDHLNELVRGTVEESLNAMLDAEADRLCNIQRENPRRFADEHQRVIGPEPYPYQLPDGYADRSQGKTSMPPGRDPCCPLPDTLRINGSCWPKNSRVSDYCGGWTVQFVHVRLISTGVVFEEPPK